MIKFEVGKEYKTRNGCKVRIYSTDTGGRGVNVIHGALFEDGQWICHSWREDGYFSGAKSHFYDLMPVLREFWVNIYKNNRSSKHPSKVEALANAYPGCLETIKVREVLEDE